MTPYQGMPVLFTDFSDQKLTAFVNSVNDDGTIDVIYWQHSSMSETPNVTAKDDDEYPTTPYWQPVGDRRTSLEAMKESVAEARLRELTAALKPVMKKDPELLAAAYGTGRHLILRAAFQRAREFLGGRK